MDRLRFRLSLVALTSCAIAGLALAVLGLGTASARTTGAAAGQATTTTITVVATEFKFKLSKRTVPAGTVIFKVVNKGKIGHDFKIAGKKTPVIAPGKSATLKVVFAKKGKFSYVCDLPGHAEGGMKGVLGVGVAAPVATGGGGSGGTTTTTVSGPSTTINVAMSEYKFDLSQTTVPQGNVTFVITNVGREVHNFDLIGKHNGKFLDPGQSESWTVNLGARTYTYVCDVPYHATSGMEGQLAVTTS